VTIADLAAAEGEWLTRLPELRTQAEVFGWEPYPLGDFARLLGVAVAAAPGAAFTDLGCGIGTKCLYAAQRGLAAGGVELEPAYADEAQALGATVTLADLRTWDGYGALAGIVYLNCPLKDETAEAALEQNIHTALAPGVVLIQVNDCGPPAGWDALADEREQFRGVYRKLGGG
jgi:trans-aconitate methyltransferase